MIRQIISEVLITFDMNEIYKDQCLHAVVQFI